MGESKVETVLREEMLGSLNPTVAPYAKDGARVRVHSIGAVRGIFVPVYGD